MPPAIRFSSQYAGFCRFLGKWDVWGELVNVEESIAKDEENDVKV